MTSISSHIVAIRSGGHVQGYQLRINGGGPGHSKLFSASKFGGPDQAKLAAQKTAKKMGLPKARPRGGSEQGRVLRSSETKVAGIRFRWMPLAQTLSLSVVASWVDRKGKPCQTAYAVSRHGLEGALDKAITARTSCGAPMPDRAVLLKLLRREYRSKAN